MSHPTPTHPNGKAADKSACCGSGIPVRDPGSGEVYPAADATAVLSASGEYKGWASPLTLELQRLGPAEMREHEIVGHRFVVNVGGNVRYGWREAEGILRSGALCIQPAGAVNEPRWRNEMMVAAGLIPHRMVDDLLDGAAPSPSETFIEARLRDDKTAAKFAAALIAEMRCPSEPLYAETLSLALVLHLMRAYGRGPANSAAIPSGKLGPAQLARAVECMHEELSGDLSLDRLASEANLSSFHFARQFKSTTGLPPHAFVLRLRVERAASSIRAGSAIALAAQEAGFSDQSHLNRVMKRIFGTTPGSLASE